MNALRVSCGTVALVLAMSAGPLIAADDSLADVKRLYMAAQFEDALAALTRAAPPGSSEADEYRVLCLIGLGRGADAEQILERIVLRNPLATPDLAGRSPKFAATYLKVHKRILTFVAPTMYGLARASFDGGKFAVASAQFKELVVVLEKSDGAGEPLSDLRMLADGFSFLSQRQEEAAESAARGPSPRKRAAAPVAVEAPAEGEIPVEETLIAMVSPAEGEASAFAETKPFAPWRPRVFGAEDRDVTPPVVVDQQMPSWIAPAAYTNVTFRGALEIMVGENGLVSSVRSLERTHPLYDTMLLAAARQWRYEPAVKDGRPVPYRKMLLFTLRGR